MNKVIVRFPPSPTGIPHIGNTRTALFNYLFAKRNNGEFFLRIEDTDQARLVPESEKAIYEILHWLGITWDGEVVRQSERLDIYKKYAQELMEKQRLYEDGGALRFKMIKTGESSWTDAIGDKHIVFENSTQEDFVAIKSDGFPTYNFANVIDDHLMGVTHVLRGEEYISSNPKYIQLYEALGWQPPVFAHLPVILGQDKTKLSKRHGAKSALDYRDEGFLKEALLNYMALLGWNPGGDKEIMSIEEMIAVFDLRDINTTSPIFDLQKMTWMNGEYIRKMSLQNLAERLRDFSATGLSEQAKESSYYKNIETFMAIVTLAQERITTLADFYAVAAHFFVEPEINTADGKKTDIAAYIVDPLSNVVWEKDSIFAVLKDVMQKFSIRMPVLYELFTGSSRGLPLPESLVILGKEKTIERLRDIVSSI